MYKDKKKQLEYQKNYRKQRKLTGPECKECGRRDDLKTGLCGACYARKRLVFLKKDPLWMAKQAAGARRRKRIKLGLDPNTPLLKAPAGSGTYTSRGYKAIQKKGHPNSWKDGGILEHIFVMSEYLGRPLLDQETVHHLNGIRDDNRIENLELWSNSHPPGQRVEDKIKFYKEFLETYGYTITKTDS